MPGRQQWCVTSLGDDDFSADDDEDDDALKPDSRLGSFCSRDDVDQDPLGAGIVNSEGSRSDRCSTSSSSNRYGLRAKLVRQRSNNSFSESERGLSRSSRSSSGFSSDRDFGSRTSSVTSDHGKGIMSPRDPETEDGLKDQVNSLDWGLSSSPQQVELIKVDGSDSAASMRSAFAGSANSARLISGLQGESNDNDDCRLSIRGPHEPQALAQIDSFEYEHNRDPLPRSRSHSPVGHRACVSLDRHRESVSADRHGGSVSPDRHRGSVSADRHRGSVSPDRHRASVSPDRHRASVSSDRHRGSVSSDRHRGSVSPDRHRGSVSPDRHRASVSSDRHRASVSSDRHRGSVSSDRHRGSVSSDRHRGSVSPDKRRGSVSSDTHRESGSPDRHRGSVSADRHRRSVSSDTHRESVSADRHRGSVSADRHRGSVNSDRHRASVSADRHRGSVSSDRHRGSVSSDRHRGSVNSDRHRGSVSSDRHRGSVSADRHRASVSADRHRASVSSDKHRGSASPDRHRESVSADRHRASVSADRHRGSASPDRHRGSVSSDRHRGSVSSDRHRASVTSDRHRGSVSSDRHRGSVSSDRHRGSVSADRHRGSVSSDRHRGSVSSDRHRGSVSPDRHRGSVSSDRHRGSVSADRHRGSVSPDRHRGSVSSDRHRGSVSPDRHRGSVSSDRYRGSVSSDRPRGSVSSDRHRRSVSSDRHRGSVSSDRHRASVSSDRHRGSASPDRHRASVSADRHRGSVSSDRHRESVSSDRHRASVSSDRHRGSASPDKHRASVSADRHRGSVSSDRHRGSVSSDRHRGSASPGRHRASVSSDRHRGSVSSDRHRGSVSSDRHRASVSSDRHRASVSSDRHRASVSSDRHRGSASPGRHRGSVSADRHRAFVSSDRHRGSVSSDKHRGSVSSDRHRGSVSVGSNGNSVRAGNQHGFNRSTSEGPGDHVQPSVQGKSVRPGVHGEPVCIGSHRSCGSTGSHAGSSADDAPTLDVDLASLVRAHRLSADVDGENLQQEGLQANIALEEALSDSDSSSAQSTDASIAHRGGNIWYTRTTVKDFHADASTDTTPAPQTHAAGDGRCTIEASRPLSVSSRASSGTYASTKKRHSSSRSRSPSPASACSGPTRAHSKPLSPSPRRSSSSVPRRPTTQAAASPSPEGSQAHPRSPRSLASSQGLRLSSPVPLLTTCPSLPAADSARSFSSESRHTRSVSRAHSNGSRSCIGIVSNPAPAPDSTSASESPHGRDAAQRSTRSSIIHEARRRSTQPSVCSTSGPMSCYTTASDLERKGNSAGQGGQHRDDVLWRQTPRLDDTTRWAFPRHYEPLEHSAPAHKDHSRDQDRGCSESGRYGKDADSDAEAMPSGLPSMLGVVSASSSSHHTPCSGMTHARTGGPRGSTVGTSAYGPNDVYENAPTCAYKGTSTDHRRLSLSSDMPRSMEAARSGTDTVDWSLRDALLCSTCPTAPADAAHTPPPYGPSVGNFSAYCPALDIMQTPILPSSTQWLSGTASSLDESILALETKLLTRIKDQTACIHSDFTLEEPGHKLSHLSPAFPAPTALDPSQPFRKALSPRPTAGAPHPSEAVGSSCSLSSASSAATSTVLDIMEGVPRSHSPTPVHPLFEVFLEEGLYDEAFKLLRRDD